MAKRYKGAPEGGGFDQSGFVTVFTFDDGAAESRALRLWIHEVNHSPTGFAWGYGGSGPAQLAYAILRDYTDDPVVARKLYQRFKDDVVSRLPRGEWTLEGDQVEAWLHYNAEPDPWSDLADAGGLPESQRGDVCPHCGGSGKREASP